MARCRIAGVGKYLPPRVVPNEELSTMMDTSDVNYYEKLHGDSFSVFSPEDMCSQMRSFFVEA